MRIANNSSSFALPILSFLVVCALSPYFGFVSNSCWVFGFAVMGLEFSLASSTAGFKTQHFLSYFQAMNPFNPYVLANPKRLWEVGSFKMSLLLISKNQSQK
jgi:hypothetical protein